ncbi:MAG: class I SAM-dependent methyltransferase [Scytonematopsis contorta HA4267-MV1]|jgi:2-polyprenyl-3-methyl-5-hydroxy-6-metoxy-1,4-benzoquinol methylase|nr:class I SAM-dependent methyltransferase [Scytonematopsis contorta HA4267-MV1]
MKVSYRTILYDNYFSNHSTQVNTIQATLCHRKYYNDYFLSKFLPLDKNINILDLGCAYGSILSSLKALGYSNFTGVDSSKEAINLLSSTDFAHKVVESDIVEFLEKSVVQGLKWDVVLAIDILEHFSKDELVKVLCLLNKVVKPQGQLIIKIPNMQSPLFSGTIALGDFTHETFVTPASLSQVLKSCGFNTVEGYEAYPVPYTFISTIRHYLWKIVRIIYTFLYAIETGSFDNSMIWSRSFFTTARNQ